VELYYTEAVYLARHRAVDVIVCVLPDELYELVSRGKPNSAVMSRKVAMI
jgi:hypothetical protein